MHTAAICHCQRMSLTHGHALQGIRLQLALPPESLLIAQPPHDAQQGAAAMLHYTWGSVFTLPANKTEVWKFDKRVYTDASIQFNVRLLCWPACLASNWTPAP